MNPTILIFQGIAPAHQNCSRAFDDMANVLDSLKVYPGFRDLVTPDDVKCLLKAIVDARIYIKNVYRHQIKNHSEIKVRLSYYFRLLFPKNYKSIFCLNSQSTGIRKYARTCNIPPVAICINATNQKYILNR